MQLRSTRQVSWAISRIAEWSRLKHVLWIVRPLGYSASPNEAPTFDHFRVQLTSLAREAATFAHASQHTTFSSVAPLLDPIGHLLQNTPRSKRFIRQRSCPSLERVEVMAGQSLEEFKRWAQELSDSFEVRISARCNPANKPVGMRCPLVFGNASGTVYAVTYRKRIYLKINRHWMVRSDIGWMIFDNY